VLPSASVTHGSSAPPHPAPRSVVNHGARRQQIGTRAPSPPHRSSIPAKLSDGTQPRSSCTTRLGATRAPCSPNVLPAEDRPGQAMAFLSADDCTGSSLVHL
jgi:hypothetical protein